MLSYQFYKVTHFVGIFLILISLGGITLHVMNDGTRQYAMRKWAAISHGVGLLLAFVAGFGLMARLGLIHGFPLWIWGKLAVWLLLGAAPALIYRQRKIAKGLWFAILFLAGIAAYLAIYKPTSAPANTANISAHVPSNISGHVSANVSISDSEHSIRLRTFCT